MQSAVDSWQLGLKLFQIQKTIQIKTTHSLFTIDNSQLKTNDYDTLTKIFEKTWIKRY